MVRRAAPFPRPASGEPMTFNVPIQAERASESALRAGASLSADERRRGAEPRDAVDGHVDAEDQEAPGHWCVLAGRA